MSITESFWKACEMYKILTDKLHVPVPLQWDVKRRLLVYKKSSCLASVVAVFFLVSPLGFGGCIFHLLILNGISKDFQPNYYTKSMERRYFEVGISFIGALGAQVVFLYILPMIVYGSEMAHGFAALRKLEDSVPRKGKDASILHWIEFTDK
jgi:hypothetical protein